MTKLPNAGDGRPGRVRAVLFDLDDTLFDHEHCARASLTAVHTRHACLRARSFEEIEQAHARLLEELHHDVMVGRLDIDSARRERFRRLFMAVDERASETLVQDAAAEYRRAYVAARRAVSGAAALLAHTRARAAVVVVSNNILEEQQNKLQHCGLDTLIDALVVSEEEGISKPDPAIFLRALARVHGTPDAAVMVGDSWAADVAGARAAGIRAIWFNRRGLPRPEAAGDVAELRSLEPVEAALAVIFGQPDQAGRPKVHANRR